MPLNTDLVSSVLSFFTVIFQSDFLNSLIIGLVDRWRSSRFTGTYTVQKHQSTLEIKDSEGHIALYSKQQRMTFIQDNVFAIQDQAWGDGNIFADYQCSPGIAVDRYKEGYRYKILISLHSNRNKGDQETMMIERKIENGFTTPVGHFQTQIDHPTNELILKVIFPRSRLPKSVVLIEQNRRRSTVLDRDHIQKLADGRVKYQWKTRRPPLYEAYIFRWEW